MSTPATPATPGSTQAPFERSTMPIKTLLPLPDITEEAFSSSFRDYLAAAFYDNTERRIHIRFVCSDGSYWGGEEPLTVTVTPELLARNFNFLKRALDLRSSHMCRELGLTPDPTLSIHTTFFDILAKVTPPPVSIELIYP